MSNDALTETCISSEAIFQGDFLHLQRDQVRLPDDSLATREFVVHPGAVMVIAQLEDGRVVMERQYRHPVKKVMVEFPAGKLDAGESGLACAQRELLEETDSLQKNGRMRAFCILLFLTQPSSLRSGLRVV